MNVFAVYGIDDNGKLAPVKPRVSRADLLPLIAQLPPCLIDMEACSGTQHWARLLRQHGHTVKLMAPKFVAPYLRTSRHPIQYPKHPAEGVVGRRAMFQ